MSEGEYDAREASSAVDAEEQEHEEYFRGLYDSREVLEDECLVERALVLPMESGNLLVDVPEGFGVAFEETLAPAFQTGYLAHPSHHTHGNTVLVALLEHTEGQKAEGRDAGEHDGYGHVDGQVADGHQEKIEEDGGEPEPEVCQEVHHRIEDDGRGGVLLADILGEGHNAVGFAPEASDGGGIVQGIAGDGEPVDAPEADLASVLAIAADDGSPGEGVQGVDDEPHADNRNQPVACVADGFPEFGKTDVEGEQHDHHRRQSDEEEEVAQSFLSPRHRSQSFSAMRRQNVS